MDNGVVLLAGVFPAGTVCTCVEVADESVLRAEGGTTVGRRVVDVDGEVGFDGLKVGGSYFVTGYVGGRFVEERVKGATRPGEVLSQKPVGEEPQVVGQQQDTIVPDKPAERPDLESGVPAGVAASEATPEASAAAAQAQGAAEVEATAGDAEKAPAVKLWVYLGDTEPADDTPNWMRTNQMTPVETNERQRSLWVWTGTEGDGTGSALWAEYEGPTVDAPKIEDVAAEATDEAVPTGTEPSGDAPAATGAKAPEAGTQGDAPAATAGEQGAAPSPSARDQLLVQAVGLGLANAASLDDDELRQSIKEKSATPVA